MKNLISELRHSQAANENNYNPDWMSDVPDDWNHTILVTSEHPVFYGKFKKMRKWYNKEFEQQLRNKPDSEINEEQNCDEMQSEKNAKAA